MKSFKIANIAVAALVITLLVILALRVRTGATADSVAILKTGGMTCGSCSDTINSVLEKQKGVTATEIDVEGGWVVVGYDTKTVKPEILAQKVSSAGFGSNVHQVLTPEQFRQITGRDIGSKASSARGCGGCSPKGGCGTNKQG